MNKKFDLGKARDFGEIIGDTFVFIGQNWKALLKTYAIICGFFIVASLTFTILNQIKMGNYANNFFNTAGTMSSRARFRIFGWSYFLTIFFTFLSYISIYLTTLCFIVLYHEKDNTVPTTEEIWSYFKSYFFSTVGSSILLSMGLCIGFVICLIPGLYLLPAFSLVVPIMVFENTTLGYAFSRAFQLVKDNFWTTLGVIVVSGIILYIATAIFILPLTILNVTSLLLSTHKFNNTYLTITAIVTHVCEVFYMMPTIAIALCYFSLTEQKDNTGLLSRINNLGNPDQFPDQFPAEEY